MRGENMTGSVLRRAVQVALLLAVACGGDPGATPPADPTSAPGTAKAPEASSAPSRVQQLLRDFHTSSDPKGWLEANAQSFSVDDAVGFDSLYKNISGGGDQKLLPVARSGAMLAAMAFNNNKRLSEGLGAWLDVNQIDFMLAQTPEQYTGIRAEALRSADRATQIRDADTTCRFLILAADASRFIFVDAQGTNNRAAVLPQLIEDMDRATASLDSLLLPKHSQWFDRTHDMVVLVARDVFKEDPKSAVGKMRARFTPLLQRVHATAFDAASG
jgi:hypothetical protein